jgi:arylformamidase
VSNSKSKSKTKTKTKAKTKHNSSHAKEQVMTSSTSVHDITQIIRPEMPVYPGEPAPEFQPYFRIGKDKVNVTKLVLSSHTGTHVDAPVHFIPGANGIDAVPLDRYIGEALTIDVSDRGPGISASDLEQHSSEVKAGDIVLLYTGTSNRQSSTTQVQTDFSYLEPSGAQWIVDQGVKCVGIDSFSMENYGFKKGLSHEKLLSNGVGIIEGLNSELQQFVGKRAFLVCLPLPLNGIDGSPARAVLFDGAIPVGT